MCLLCSHMHHIGVTVPHSSHDQNRRPNAEPSLRSCSSHAHPAGDVSLSPGPCLHLRGQKGHATLRLRETGGDLICPQILHCFALLCFVLPGSAVPCPALPCPALPCPAPGRNSHTPFPAAHISAVCPSLSRTSSISWKHSISSTVSAKLLCAA